MTPVWFVARSRIRGRWRSWSAIVAVIVVAGAAVMTLTAGARRAETVYPRFLKSSNVPDVVVESGAGIGLADLDPSRVAALPQVAQSAFVPVYFSLGRTGAGRLIPPRTAAPVVADSTVFAGGLERVKILSGRRARLDRPDEMVADFSLEKSYGIGVGSTLTIRFTTPAGLPGLFTGLNNGTPESLEVGPLVNFHVVGLGAIAGQFPPVASAGLPLLWMTPAFASQYASQLAHTNTVAVRLRRGDADLNAFKSAVEQMAAGRPVLFHTQGDSTAAVERSFRSQAISLYILAALLALVAILVVGQALTRQAWAQSGDIGLLAIGMTRGQRAAAFATQALLGGAVGATAAVAVAYLLSPLMPLGLARIADPAPGFSVDAPVLGGVLVIAAAVTGALAAVQGWRAEGRLTASSQPPATLARPVGSWLPVGAVVGLGFALRSPRGGRAMSPRAAISGIVVGLLTVTATVVFGASLGHLISTPRLWGATWQARVGDGFGPDTAGAIGSGLRADPWVRDLAAGSAGQLQLDGRVRVDAFAVDVVKGSISPLVLQGRVPKAADEIFVGTAALRSLGAAVGDRVTVAVGPA